MLRKFWKDESGLETVEYAVVGALVILVAAGTIKLLGEAVNTKFGELEARVNGD